LDLKDRNDSALSLASGGNRETIMNSEPVDRRTMLTAATSLGAAALLPGQALAQGGPPSAPGATLPARGEFVIRGAQVLTMDDSLGDMANGDVHVRNGEIVAVGASMSAPGAEVIEGRGMICMPGFIDTHWHHWTSICRPFVRGDDPARGYFPVTSKLGPHYRPEDSYRAVRLGIAEALSAGVTATHNWAHNVRSPAHADAELRAMRDSGIRGRFAYGSPQGAPDDQPMDIADLARVKKEWITLGGLISLGICSRNVGDASNPMRGNISVEMAKREWGAARELGLPITMHTSGASPIRLLHDNGLLGPDLQLVHPLLTTPEERAMLKDKGTSYSTSPIGESRRPASAGVIQLAELIESGVRVSMSIDHTTNYNCDCFGCMRMLMSLHQHRVGNRVKLTNKRLVELATIDGARDLGISDQAGSLKPGKRADLILIRATDVNMAPASDPYEMLVSRGQPGNVDTVVVDGRVLRRGGRFTALDYDQVIGEAMASAAELQARAA
jgi:cytosine/adenosine deaminase-related metal-dependent hydrolase